MEEFINVDGDALRSRGLLDAASVEVERVEVRDSDSFSYSLLMLPGPWLGTRRCKPSADGCESRVSLLRLVDFPWKDHRNFGSGLDDHRSISGYR